MLLHQILVCIIHRKTQKTLKKTHLNCQPQHGKKNLNVADHTLQQIFKIISSVSSKYIETEADNPPIRIYVNKLNNQVTFRIKIGYCFKLLTPETTKLLRSNKSKITKKKNGKNMP